MITVQVSIPIRLPSLANTRMHWRTMAALKRKQRAATRICLQGKELPTPPVIVTITRVGPRKLDDDNLASACKYIRDQIAYAIGLDDGSSLYTWKYQQRTGRYSVEIEITKRDNVSLPLKIKTIRE